MSKNSHPSVLDRLTVPTPCSEDWDSMSGNDRVRLCSHCALSVNNLSALTRSEAISLVNKSQGRLCVRYYRRPDGLVQTATDNLHSIKRRASRLAAGAFTATLSLAASVVAQTRAPAAPSLQENVQIINTSEQVRPQRDGGWDGTLKGTITDPMGAVVPGMKITLVEEETKLELAAVTDDEGAFYFQSLSPGVYSLKTEETHGFAAREVREIRLPAPDGNNVVTLNLEPTGQYATVGIISITEPSDALVSAAFKDDLRAVKTLIAAGADVNVVDKSIDQTALMSAVSNGNREMIEALIAAGAQVNARSNVGQTALMMVSEKTATESVWALISAGAKVNRKDVYGNTALIIAAARDTVPVVRALIDAGAKVNARDSEGRTALIWAAQYGKVESVRALLRAGCDVNKKTNDGETALSLAIENRHTEIVKLLEDSGARP